MKISHPRFLNIGDQDVLHMEFPPCLEKRGSSVEGLVPMKTNKASDGIFLFPEVIWIINFVGLLVNIVYFVHLWF